MITEKDALDALPSHGFVRAYCQYAAVQTTAPLAYHIGVAMSMLAVTCPLGYGTRYAINQRPNLFVMLAGRSGDDQKSTAIEIGREILFEACPTLIGDQPGSSEGMIESLSKQPTQLLIYKEMGKLLASTQRGYLEPLKALLTDLSDCSSQQRVKAKQKGENNVIRVDSPRLSIIGACSLPFLEKHTEAVDWTGGFLGRWALLYAQRERTNCWPAGTTHGRAALVQSLASRSLTPTAGWMNKPTGHVGKIWKDWFEDVDHRKLPDLVAGARTRAPIVALKAALLYGWDLGHSHSGEPWEMDTSVLDPAIKFAELYLTSIVNLSGKLAEHPDARVRRNVLGCFGHGEALKLGQVLKRTKLRKRTVSEILDSLTVEGTIKRLNLPNGESVYIQQAGPAS